MGHFAGQHLPAGELRQIDQPVAVLFQLRGGAVERVGRKADFVGAVVGYADFKVAAGQAAAAPPSDSQSAC